MSHLFACGDLLLSSLDQAFWPVVKILSPVKLTYYDFLCPLCNIREHSSIILYHI